MTKQPLRLEAFWFQGKAGDETDEKPCFHGIQILDGSKKIDIKIYSILDSVCVCVCVCVHARVCVHAQSHPTLGDPMDCGPLGSFVFCTCWRKIKQRRKGSREAQWEDIDILEMVKEGLTVLKEVSGIIEEKWNYWKECFSVCACMF